MEQVDQRALEQAAVAALVATEAQTPASLSVVITDTQAVQQLNAQHLGYDEPTDVLSFPSEEQFAEPGQPPYLGDILVALPVAQQQAVKAGYSTQDELNLLTVHGVLHLLGYDHDSPGQQAEMWALQSEALNSLRQDSR